MCASEIDVEDSSCQSEQIWNGLVVEEWKESDDRKIREKEKENSIGNLNETMQNRDA